MGKSLGESFSAVFGRFIEETRYETLTDDVRHAAYRAVLDWVGSTLRGGVEPPARIVQRLVERWGGSGNATVLTTGKSSTPAWAALLNGVASHIVELDDLHRGSTFHPAAPIIPAALAAAEEEGSSMKEFLAAVVVGYDVGIRIAEAVNPSHYRFWHTTGTCGTFGAAAAVAKILHLNPAQVVDALGSAGTQAAALWEFIRDGAMSKSLHTGKAAMNGLLAAYLARDGFTGATRILEGDRGFFAAMAEEADVSKLTDRLGQHFKIVENDFKLHACCGHTHTAADLAIEGRRELGTDVDQIASIKVETYPEAIHIAGNPDPRTPYEAKFSIAFCVAAAWIRGDLGLAAFAPEVLRDETVRGLMRRIEVTAADDLAARYPALWPARLTVELKSGRRWTRSGDNPLGSYQNPASDEVLQRKFDGMVAEASVPAPWLDEVRSWLERLRNPGEEPVRLAAAAGNGR